MLLAAGAGGVRQLPRGTTAPIAITLTTAIAPPKAERARPAPHHPARPTQLVSSPRRRSS